MAARVKKIKEVEVVAEIDNKEKESKYHLSSMLKLGTKQNVIVKKRKVQEVDNVDVVKTEKKIDKDNVDAKIEASSGIALLGAYDDDE